MLHWERSDRINVVAAIVVDFFDGFRRLDLMLISGVFSKMIARSIIFIPRMRLFSKSRLLLLRLNIGMKSLLCLSPITSTPNAGPRKITPTSVHFDWSLTWK